MDVQGVSLSTTFSLDVHWVSLGILSSLPTTAFLNAGMSDCVSSSQSGNGMNINSAEGTMQSDTRIRWYSPVPECSGTGLRYRMSMPGYENTQINDDKMSFETHKMGKIITQVLYCMSINICMIFSGIRCQQPIHIVYSTLQIRHWPMVCFYQTDIMRRLVFAL